MTAEAPPLQQCLADIEARLEWGPAARWTNQDFETLSDRIAAETGVTLSGTTLKRVWGRVAYSSSPSTTTLDALARFAGHAHWRAYRASRSGSSASVPVVSRPGRSLLVWLIPSLLVAVVLTLLLGGVRPAPASTPAPDPDDFYLNFRPVSTGVPNSVVFTYAAAAAPTEAVYLQQSWDPRRREQLAREGTTHTSIYYLPGYYRAKLVVDDRVVQERELLIPSEGWVAAIDVGEIPVYLPAGTAIAGGRIRVTEADFAALSIPLQPEPPTVMLTNVGTLGDLYTDDFTFRTRFRHDYATGAGACQHARILILLKNSVIATAYSAAGCVADLNVYAGGQSVSGRDTDLSAFGVTGDEWVEVTTEGRRGLINFSIDGRPVFQLESEEDPREIIGIRYEFSGPASVDEVYFGNTAGEVWRDSF